jgi:multiple sugar transport system ATP-binding protein
MAHIKLDRLTKHFGKQTAVSELSLEINENEFVALLGPSGCGKTTTMNMISGLLDPDSGKVYFDGREMNQVAPGRRGVGFVFQNYAVFTHMTAYDNIACGLKVQKTDRDEIERQVMTFARLMKIDHLLHVNAGKLSINDMQKVALARTLVTQPRILLLDEPLSNLDAALRNVMRAELKRIHLELGQTTIYVTHDQVEAMSLADKIAVMNFAVLQQFDTPDEVYHRPKNLFVANFIGSPTMNFLKSTFRKGDLFLEDFPDCRITLSPETRVRVEGLIKHERVTIGIRPEHLEVVDGVKNSSLTATVVSYEPLGSETIVYLKPPGGSENILKSIMDSDYRTALNTRKGLKFEESSLYLFDDETTELVLKI